MSLKETPAPLARTVYLMANGDLRLSANQKCWPEQERMEAALIRCIQSCGYEVKRAHDYHPSVSHGFIDSQKAGLNVFRQIDPKLPIIVAESVWQYSQHILGGLLTHEGPILTVANWSGTWPGLVGMLNLNGSLTKMGVRYSSLWSVDFSDAFFMDGLKQWLETGFIRHDQSHVRHFCDLRIDPEEDGIGREFARGFRRQKAIMGVFDEGCMGMHNAIIPDELLNPAGVFKERLSQSALYAATRDISDEEARGVFQWLVDAGISFDFGPEEESDLTETQVLTQCKMYIAALRISDEFGCDTVGIQYQQGLKDLLPASDLVEGLLNNRERPPVASATDGKLLYEGEALPHFNEVDECAGLDALITYRLWKKLGQPPETTLHDLRWGENYPVRGQDEFVWVFLISGAAPAAHFIDGYRGASSLRQPAMYFRLGGGTLRGISRPGFIVWSRVFIMDGQLQCDLGVAEVVSLPEGETERRWQETTPQWPIMHAVLRGISRDQMMARHKSNHIQVAYCNSLEDAERCCHVKAAAMDELGIRTQICGEVRLG
jgi:L-fucose isomerase-like protein